MNHFLRSESVIPPPRSSAHSLVSNHRQSVHCSRAHALAKNEGVEYDCAIDTMSTRTRHRLFVRYAQEDTRMRDAPEPPLEELLWTAAAARLIFGPDMAVQARVASRPSTDHAAITPF